MIEREIRRRRQAVRDAIEALYVQWRRPLRVREIATHAGVSVSAAHRHIVWLWSAGQCERTQHDGCGSVVPVGKGAQWG
jgi:DNA-binding IclR family transcriptional regulator